jgi:hypothetical protein
VIVIHDNYEKVWFPQTVNLKKERAACEGRPFFYFCFTSIVLTNTVYVIFYVGGFA